MLRWKFITILKSLFGFLGRGGSDENRVNKLIQRKCKIKPDNRRFRLCIGERNFVMKSNSILETFSNIWRTHIRPKGYANAIHGASTASFHWKVNMQRLRLWLDAQQHTNGHKLAKIVRIHSQINRNQFTLIRRLHGTLRRKFSHSMSSGSCWGQVQ